MPVEQQPDDALERKLAEAFGPLTPHPQPEAVMASSGGWMPPVPEISVPRGGIPFPVQQARPQPMIYALMNSVMAAVSHVGKTGFNEQQRYNFRGIDAVVNALGPAMRTYGITPVPKLLKATYRDAMTTQNKPTREVTVEVRYRFYAPDGSYIQAVVPGESLDQSDKGTAKAMSVAYRIALLQVFALPTDEPDPDASYHTRDGMGAMAATVATMMAQLLPTATGDDLVMYWPIVLEHSAAERPMDGSSDSGTWAEAFGRRFAELIEQVETWQQGREMKQNVDLAGLGALTVEGRTLARRLEDRADFLKDRRAKTFDHSMVQITEAKTLDELDTAIGCFAASVEVGVLSEAQAAELSAVASERSAKLAQTDGYLPTEGLEWDNFAYMIDNTSDAAEIMTRLTNEDEGAHGPAIAWGSAGLQRVYDAVVRAHARDHAISNEQRAELEQAIREHAEMAGVEWSK